MGKQVYLTDDELLYLKILISNADPSVYTSTHYQYFEEDKKEVEKEDKIIRSLDKKFS
ncbi:hypothetical protein PQE75_gp002 [Bacillus phage vB_BcoS-136]|uniref:Uncharacterized protein n=1 Tax=Bacillus phage vB_BcoS-136 TaxID=2419619 RepID=A0A3G3BV96_9CAUD|nr:hypothetical protein PQE75_gp002 [Bacillus phage vB_BcoS-136]AYP68134.1 hypothetical protein vBBcoS136_00002 [Bacillus phage vB_BcoS-136]